MKSKASYFSVSGPLLREDIRRFWVIPLLGFLAYFLSGILPILMSYRSLNDMASYISMTLAGQTPVFVITNVVLPVAAAAYVFRYLQTTSSVTALHAMPFTRAKLFNSNVLAGLFLCVIPVLLISLIFIAIHKPALDWDNNNVFTMAAILRWTYVTLTTVFFTYAVSVLAGILTGSSIMQVIASLGLNAIVPALYCIVCSYGTIYLYGFEPSESWDKAVDLFPVVRACVDRPWGIYAIVLAILSLLLLVAASILYHKRKLEHATNPIAFRFLEPVFCWLVAFLGMTLLGFFFCYLYEDICTPNPGLYIGIFVGALLFYAIGLIIVQKTPRIFNKKNLRGCLLYLIATTLFLCGWIFDVTGFETRIPDARDVNAVKISIDQSTFWDFNRWDPVLLESKESIQNVAAIHGKIIEAHEKNGDTVDSYLPSTEIKIQYKLGSRWMMRSYTVYGTDFLKNNKEIKTLTESKEYKLVTSFAGSSNAKQLKTMSLYPLTSDASTVNIVDQEEMKELLDCIEKDYRDMTYEQIIDTRRPFCTFDVDYYTAEDLAYNKTHDEEDCYYSSSFISLSDHCKNTIAWIKANGCWDLINTTANNFSEVAVLKYTPSEDEDLIGDETLLSVVSDPAQIQALWDNAKTENDLDTYYIVRFYTIGGNYSDDNFDFMEYYMDELPKGLDI